MEPSERQVVTLEEMGSDLLVLTEALYHIMHESGEAQVVLDAAAALVKTRVGLAYLTSHPVGE